VAVKVLSENTGIGLLSYLNEAIVYAADNGADVINMSLGGYLPRRNGWWVGDFHVTAKMVGEMLHATQRAINYAYQQGATMVAAAGNSALDADHDKNAVLIPAQLTHVIAVSATDMWDGPWYLNNYGKTLVSFAAPGDWVLSDINNNKFAYWSGTSQAAAHVSGVAALIIGQNGGSLHPAQVESVLKQSADDLGKPGNDDYYGMGRVNAYKAVLYSR
jgi:subtilisin family serine protease